MKRFALIGYPISHSLSPALFRAAYGGKWAYELLEDEDFSRSWERFLSDYDGINVTAPFKELAFRSATVLSPDALRTGAVNTVVRTPEGTFGDNTDYKAVSALLSGAEAGTPALVIGCGGAGKAAAMAAADAGLKVTLFNRTPEKAMQIAALHPEGNFSVISAPSLKESIARAGIILYTASGPLDGMEEYFAGVSGKTVIEANYRRPAFSSGLKESVTSDGGRYEGGEAWLLAQAISAFLIFTGEQPDLDAMKAVISSIIR
jgi:shikimate dehydrogenase